MIIIKITLICDQIMCSLRITINLVGGKIQLSVKLYISQRFVLLNQLITIVSLTHTTMKAALIIAVFLVALATVVSYLDLYYIH